MGWLENLNINVVKVCEVCGAEAENLVRVKIENVVYNICKDCVEKYNYTEYTGDDVLSDWN